MAFGKGDRVRVKAGAKIHPLAYSGGDVKIAEKSRVVTIDAIGTVGFIPGDPTHRNPYFRVDRQEGFQSGRTGHYAPGTHYFQDGKVQIIRSVAIAWGSGAVEEADVELVQKAADVVVKERKKPEVKEKPTEFRTKLAKGTKWVATKDLQCWKIAYGRNYKYSVLNAGVIKKGEEFTVVTKPSQTWMFEDTPSFDLIGLVPNPKGESYRTSPKMKNGKQAFDVAVKGPNANGHLVVYEMEQGCEPANADQIIPVYYVLDTETNQFMGKGESVWNSSVQHWQTNLLWKDTIRGARKFKRIADVRSFAINGSGYYDNLRGAVNLPEWVGGGKAFDVKDSWVIVEYDLNTNKETRRIELIDTFKRTWAMREITQKYGSSVRTIYSELEKKGKLGDWKYIVSFSHPPHVTKWATYVDELSGKEISEIEDMLSVVDKSLFSKAKTDDGYAIAVKDAPEITLLQLSYAGNLQFAIIDIETLDVTVKEAQTV